MRPLKGIDCWDLAGSLTDGHEREIGWDVYVDLRGIMHLSTASIGRRALRDLLIQKLSPCTEAGAE